jgi:hypothetical protein
MMIWLYRVVTVAALGLYAAAGFLGWDFQEKARTQIPQSVRQSPGGYRSFHFWHTGFQGGK